MQCRGGRGGIRSTGYPNQVFCLDVAQNYSTDKSKRKKSDLLKIWLKTGVVARSEAPPVMVAVTAMGLL